jgi:hypothetical protein
MKWSYFVEQKLKLALLLSIVMFLIILTNILERKNIGDINHSVESIYQDRLVPATDIFYLTENLYNKRFLLENYLSSGSEDGIAGLEHDLKLHNEKIASLISKYEKTYLVEQELKSLGELKSRIKYYESIEKDILVFLKNSRRDAGIMLYEEQAKPAHNNTIYHLSVLNRIQSSVGGELIKDSKGIVASSNLLSTLQIVLAVITGVIIIILIFSSRIVNQTQKNYHWN